VDTLRVPTPGGDTVRAIVTTEWCE
jgi:hypothetical protein